MDIHRCKLAVLLLFASLATAAQSQPMPPAHAGVYPFADVKLGLKGTGYTVMSGDSLSTFRAEVLGTVEQGASQPRMIICRLSGDGLEGSGVLAAMSGSPIYAEGKFLGAVAYAWPFAKEPLCGVTPAEDMMAVEHGAADMEPSASSGRTMALSGFLNLLPRAGETPRAASTYLGIEKPPDGHDLMQELSSLGFEWTMASRQADAVGAGGQAIAEAPGPGGMIGVQLVSGDVQMAAYGTVSWVEGKRFLAFGHPFLRLGSVELPVVGARVVTAVPSLMRSFKLSKPTAPVGVITQDRSAGVFGLFGRRAPMLPVDLEFTRPGLGVKRFHFEVVRHRQLMAYLVGGALKTLWASQEDATAYRTLIIRDLSISAMEGQEIHLRDQAFSGSGAFDSAADYLTSALELLTNNPYESVSLSAVRMKVEVLPGNRTAAIESAWLDRDAVRPGEDLKLSVRIRPYQERPKVIALSIPTDQLPPGEVTLWVGGAFDVLKKEAETARDLPRDGASLLRYLERIPNDQSLSVTGVFQEQAAVLQYHRVGGLPPSLESLLRAAPTAVSADQSPARFLFHREAAGVGLVDGLLELTFTVKENSDHAE
jgi:hypothetical protein